jgi:hypothetical protein
MPALGKPQCKLDKGRGALPAKADWTISTFYESPVHLDAKTLEFNVR